MARGKASSAIGGATSARGWPGWETVRFTRRQLLRDPDWVIATTAALLDR